MSLKINIDSLTDEQREKIANDLTVSPEPVKKGAKSFYTPKAQAVELFDLDEDSVIVPFSYGVKNLGIKKPKTELYDKIRACSFSGHLRDTQKTIKDEAIQNLNTYGAAIISCYPGFGKTITSIYISSKIGLKTMIIVNRVVLMNQWKEAINNFLPDAKVQFLSPKKKWENDADFFIINAINVSKFGSHSFQKVGTIIVDEAHLIMSGVLSQSLRFLFPKYLIGLSATPYRTDGFNVLLDLYFTEVKIIRKLFHPHIVYKIETGFTPEVEYDRNGTVNWGKIIESQSVNKERNNFIISLVQKHYERNILILTKRIEQANYLYEKLKAAGEKVDTFIESQTEFDKDSRVLIGTTSKVGVGFDHDKLDALILASDLEEYFIQYLGRVFRRQDITPVIFDLVDNNSILKRHFLTRKSTYLEAGGKIEKYVI
uniref:Helicase ATP-binding domain-containing protein n=1 Tax=viral metagenome TaxID=1070528 RepID=A0A6C0KSD3_9ZZZZ